MTPVHALGDYCLTGEVAERYGQSTQALQWLAKLPELLAQGELIYQLRNQIVVLIDPLDPTVQICVKAFAAPSALRQAWYRRVGSKAQRAHRYACHLFQPGANSLTTEPLGYLEAANGQSFLLNRFLPNATDFYSEMHHLYTQRPLEPDFLRLLQRVAEACRDMHNLGFRHADLGPQNILLQRAETPERIDWPQLALIDLNRGRLKAQLTLAERATDLAHLRIPTLLQPLFNAFYLGEDTPPTAFTAAQHRQRQRIAWHVKTRRWRHPIRTIKRHFQLEPAKPKKELSTEHRSPLDAWLWNPQQQAPTRLWTHAEVARLRPAEFKTNPAAHQQKTKPTRPEFYPRQNGPGLGQTLPQPSTDTDSLKQPSILIQLVGQVGPNVSDLQHFAEDLPEAQTICLTFVPTRFQWQHPQNIVDWVSQVLEVIGHRVQCLNVGLNIEDPHWGVWAYQEALDVYQALSSIQPKYSELCWMTPWMSIDSCSSMHDFWAQLPPWMTVMALRLRGIEDSQWLEQTLTPGWLQGYSKEAVVLLGQQRELNGVCQGRKEVASGLIRCTFTDKNTKVL